MLDDPNIETLECGHKTASAGLQPATAGDIILLLKNRDIFDTRSRIIKLQGIPADYALLANYLHLVNDRNMLVVNGPIGYRLKGKKRFISAANSKFYKTFVSKGKVFNSLMEVKRNSDAINWVQGVATDLNKKLDAESAELLVEMKGRNLDNLYAEINKLASYQTGKKITLEDVKACCVLECQNTTWELVDLLNRQNYDGALSKLQEFYGQAGIAIATTFYGDCHRLIGALNKNFTFLLMLKDSCGDSLSFVGAKKAAANYKKRMKKGDVYHWNNDVFEERWMSMQMRNQGVKTAMNLPQRHLYAVKRDICRCMFLCRKYSTITSRIKLCLDSLIMLICGKLSAANSANCKGWK